MNTQRQGLVGEGEFAADGLEQILSVFGEFFGIDGLGWVHAKSANVVFVVEKEGGGVFVASGRLGGRGWIEFLEVVDVLVVHFSIKIINKIMNQF